MRAIRLAVIGSILLISFLTLLIQPLFASSIGEIPVIKISPQNKMAVVKTPVNTLHVIKAGEFLDKHAKSILWWEKSCLKLRLTREMKRLLKSETDCCGYHC